MWKVRHFLAAAALASLGSLPGAQRPAAGSVLDATQRFTPGTYRLSSADIAHPALTIRGSNLTVDFTGVTLRGADVAADPDTFTGLAVLVDGGENVTIRNLSAHGYKIGLLARQTKNLRIVGADLGYNWKARLYSLVEHESLLDWLSYHHNDADEWIEQGAGLYLADTDGAEVTGSRVLQGQNGLMLVRSTNAKVWNNTFSYLSGIGLGLYRSTGNTIQHNRIDYCVRGYSEGFYNRGQDSAGILMYEQSSGNVVAYNSVTHDGDGLFLWAGQTTMDTGEGGANDNLFYRNDFSFAPTNGIEATFSRNAFVENRVEGNWHGVWGGYSYDSDFLFNRFSRNVEGIAIEHGQRNRIHMNTFDRDETAIRLWQNATQDPDWGYPKHRDTRSRDYAITSNRFVGNKVAIKITATDTVGLVQNRFERVGTRLDVSADSRNVPATAGSFALPHRDYVLPRPMPRAIDTTIPDAERRGRDSIIVDEWGPYDWRSPKLWPDGRSDARPLKLRVLGPPGEWKIGSIRGATIEPASGRVPGEVTVIPATGTVEDFDVRLVYRGGQVTSPRGTITPAGQPYEFGYSSFSAVAPWTVRYFAYDAGTKLDTDSDGFASLTRGRPTKSETLPRIDFESGGPIAEGLPADRVALTAEADVDLPSGDYTIRTISDDGVRVFVDGKRAIDDWTPHESSIDRAPLAGGRHRIRIEYYEVTGFAELRFDILRH